MSKLFESYGVSFRKGEVVFREGDKADYIYLIHRGKIRISISSGSSEEEIQLLGEPEFFGEMAIVNQAPRSANATAAEDCELIRMDKESFDRNVKDNHHFAVNVIRMLSERLRKADQVITSLNRQDRKQKLYAAILKNMHKNGKEDKSGQWLLIPYHEFYQQFLSQFAWSSSLFESAIQALLEDKSIYLKKNSDGLEYISISLL